MRTEVSETLGKLKIIEATAPRQYKVIFALTEKYNNIKELNSIVLNEDNLHKTLMNLQDDELAEAITINRRSNALQFIVDDKNKSNILPHPFKKGVFNDFVGEVSIVRSINHLLYDQASKVETPKFNKYEHSLPTANIILVEIKTFEPDSSRKTITKTSRQKIDRFKSLIEGNKDMLSFTLTMGKEKLETINAKESIISESGLKNAKEEMDKYIAQVVQDALQHPDLDSIRPSQLLFDESITDAEYINQITFGLHDSTQDYYALNNLFNELQYRLIYRSLSDFMFIQLNILYKTQIGERRMKSLVGYILETGGLNVTLSELLTSAIPENIIISRDTPFLNFKRVKLKPLKDEEK